MTEDNNEFEKFKLLYSLPIEEANKDTAMILALVLSVLFFFSVLFITIIAV